MTVTFDSLGLRQPLVQAVMELGYENATPIQERAIPALLEGRDILGQAQTGTGKTAAFALPLLERLDISSRKVQGLILTPTRELALQVTEAIYQYGKHLNARVVAIYGGSSYTRQLKRLDEGVHVVVGTPGRVIDLIERGALDLHHVRFLVLDEADEMLKMGFIDDVETILRATPPERQTALFSATLSDAIRSIAKQYMHDPQLVAIEQKTLTVPQIEQRYYLVEENSKVAALARLLEVEDVHSALIFTRTKLGAASLADTLLTRLFPVEALHGDLSQEARETVMRRFRRGQITILVATDVAARGLDIQDMSHVINFDVPYDAEDYVHRIGRTGRAGREGIAITLVTPRERRWLKTIEQFTRQPIRRAKLPNVDEVIAKRDQRFTEKLSNLLETEDFEREVNFIHGLIAVGYDATEIAAAAIRLARAGELQRPIEDIQEPRERTYAERQAARDREGGGRRFDRGGERRFERSGERRYDKDGEDRERPRRRSNEREAGMVRLMIDAGRVHGIQPGDVVGVIASEAGIPGRAIGAIDIQKNQTFVDVNEMHVERVLKRMKTGTMRGRQVTLRRAE
ncbi:MAG: DEAD/DEAH box helicase [Anaerolinea sp.]|nr:DEAD/DEAH box helicase [Anaerolinea sp.]